MPKLNLNLKGKNGLRFDLKTKIIAMAGVCVLLIIIWFIVVSNYKSGKTSQILSEGELLKRTYQSKYQFLVNLKESAKKTDELEVKVNELYTTLLPIEYKQNPIDEITRVGNEEKLKFIYFKPQTPEANNNFIVTPMDISLTGDYGHVLDFLAKLSQLKLTVIINDFILMRRGTEDNDVIMNARINILNGLKEAAPDVSTKKAKPAAKAKKKNDKK